MNARFFKVCGLFLSLLLIASTASAQDNAVLQWDQAALQAVRNTRHGAADDVTRRRHRAYRDV